MEIKTITCHDVYNYGASLQAYALMKYLQSKGHSVEIIDYKPWYLSQRYKLFAISPSFNKNIFLKLFYFGIKIPYRLIFEWPRKRVFDKFTKDYLQLTANTYQTFESLKDNPPLADIYIAGSDQIWNTSYENGKDPSFYLNFAPSNKIKASYAASFSISELDSAIKPQVKDWLSNFNFISVRENTGLKILDDLEILNGEEVVDPVFLLDKEDWNNITPPKNVKGKYILIYDFEQNPEIKRLAMDISKTKDIQIVSVTDYIKIKYSDVVINNAGPLEFLSLIKHCDYFLSNSFHGTVFSIIFNKEFFVFNRMKQKVNSRMVDMLDVLNLSDRLIADCYNKWDNKIDYNIVSQKIGQKILSSKSYISTILHEK